MEKKLRPWIEKRIEELSPAGKSKSGLAKVLGIAPPRITEIILGERGVKVAETKKMADYLEWDEQHLTERLRGDSQLSPSILRNIRVRGTVEAGFYREALEWPEEEWYSSGVSPLKKFEHLPQFALEVRGSSMNLKYKPGTILICVNLIHLGRDPVPPEKVIVTRSLPNGLVEATVKELHKKDDGTWWLIPRSDDPAHQAPIPLTADDPFGDNDDLKITALVIGAVTPEA